MFDTDNMTLLVDPDTRDLVLDDEGIMQTILGHETTAQCIRHTLLVWKGEWIFDTNHGTDYERIMGKKPQEMEQDEPEEVYRDAIFQESLVAEIESLTVSREGRALSAEFVGLLTDGTKISTEVTTT